MKHRFLSAALAAGLISLGGAAHAGYPERSIQATIPYGVGGLTDIVSRSLAPHAERELGGSLVLNNRVGASGVIGVNYVRERRPDGYSLLFGVHDAMLYPVLDIADFSYEDFSPVNLIGQGLVVIVASPDSPWESMEELMADVQANPGTVRMGTVGTGTTPHITHSIIGSVEAFDVREVTFGGDGPGITALMGSHIDFMPLSLAPAREYIDSGRLKGLAIMHEERIEALPDVPAITEAIPEVAPYMPWGSFQGVFVHRDTPEEIKRTLGDAFAAAVATPEFEALYTRQFGGIVLNLRDEEAEDYMARWQSQTAWLLEEVGEARVSPEALGIPRP